MSEPEGKRGFWAKCRVCAHCWIAAYLPMEMRAAARLLGKTACPMCGDGQPTIARQDNGVLLEGQAA